MTSDFPTTQTKTLVRNLVVVGTGLIGGSLACAAKKNSLCERTIGVARRENVARKAVELGVVDEAVISIEQIASRLGAGDVIFIAVPTLSVRAVLSDIARTVAPEVTITDGASVIVQRLSPE